MKRQEVVCGLRQATDGCEAADTLVNWACALYALGRFDRAESAARHALARAPGLLRAQYVLGLALMAQEKSQEECLRALDNAAAEFPKAREFAARIRQRLQASAR